MNKDYYEIIVTVEPVKEINVGEVLTFACLFGLMIMALFT